MAGELVMRNYVQSYLDGVGNDMPVFRVGGSNDGQLIFKNQWKPVITRRGIFTGTLYMPEVWEEYNGNGQELFTRACPVSAFYGTSSSDPFTWESSTTKYYNPPAAGITTYYRSQNQSYSYDNYGTGRADGNCPIHSSGCLGWRRGGSNYGLGLPGYIQLESHYDTFAGSGGPFQHWITIVQPWWGQNNATTDVGDYGPDVTQAQLNLPEGYWGLLVQTCYRTFRAYINNVRTEISLYSCGLYISNQQHKASYPWIPGREALTFTYSRLINEPYHDIDQGGSLIVSSREDFYRSQTFELTAEPV